MDFSLLQGIVAAILVLAFTYLTNRRKAIGSTVTPHSGLDV